MDQNDAGRAQEPIEETPSFIPGLELAGYLYHEAVRPILSARFPGLAHSAGRLGEGSDVLGFDTPRSIDHDWGPKVTLFLSEDDLARHGPAVNETLARELPREIRGYSTHFATVPDDPGVMWMAPAGEGPIRHGIEMTTVERFARGYVGIDATHPVSVGEWLAIAPQRLRTVASGRVFHDGLGALEPLRAALRRYPRDVWLYLMACQWRRIDQEEPFVGRTGEAGDELGSRLVAARQAIEMMRLCFLIEGEHAPYMKWFGTAFARLRCAPTLEPLFHQALDAPTWREREAPLSAARVHLAHMHNDLGVTPPLEAAVSPFWGRPYMVLHAGRFVDALRATITDEQVLALPPYRGAVWQYADSTDVLSSIDECRALAGLPPLN